MNLITGFKKKKIILLIVVITIALAISIFASLNHVRLQANQIIEKGQWIDHVNVDRSLYAPNEQVTITASITNHSERLNHGKIIFIIKHLGKEVGRIETNPFSLEKSKNIELQNKWLPPNTDYQGYLVEAWLVSKNKVLDKMNTAIDISSDWSKFPRYGYITNFGDLSTDEIKQNIDILNQYHINGLQFYDWQYKHHQPLAGTVEQPASQWKDIANRDTYFTTVKEYIDQAHAKNMMAMNYNLLFGAYQYSEKDGVLPEWGLYKDRSHKRQDGHPLPNIWATSKLILENPLNKDWQNYILQKERHVFKALPFDGWHIDQLGDRGTLYDFNGNKVDLYNSYTAFIKQIKEKLQIKLVMNAVNQYGDIAIGGSPVDFLYTEVWPPTIGSYGQLKDAIDRGIKLSKGTKNVVLAAYMNYKKADHKGEFNTPSVLLTDAVIFAAGGDHIELGDTGMLGKEYFPNHNLKMSPDLQKSVKDYYDFLVAYENLLRDQVTPISRKINIDQMEVNSFPIKKAIWYFSKEKENYEILHLINFDNNSSLNWRDDDGMYKKPKELKDFVLKYYTDKEIGKVYLASPDIENGSSQVIPYTRGEDEHGHYLEMTIPSITYWDMIYFERK